MAYEDECDDCRRDYPTECVCGGMVHGHFEDENWDSIILRRWCEDCVFDYQEARDV